MKKFLYAIAFILPFCFSVKGYCASQLSQGCYITMDFGLSHYSAGDKGFFTVYVDSTYSVFGYGRNVTLDYYGNISTLNGSFYIGSYKSSTAQYLTNGYFDSFGSAKNFYDNYTDVEFDDNITLGAFFPLGIDLRDVTLGIIKYQNIQFWHFGGTATSVRLEYFIDFGSSPVFIETQTNSIIPTFSVFTPSQYDVPDGSIIVCRATPLDDSGNFGTSREVSWIASTVIPPNVVNISDNPFLEPVINDPYLDNVRPFITPYNPVHEGGYSTVFILDDIDEQLTRLTALIEELIKKGTLTSPTPQPIITTINPVVTFEPIETDFDTPTFKNDFKGWKNTIVDYLMQFNGTPFSEPFSHLVTVILILSGLALALLIIKRL